MRFHGSAFYRDYLHLSYWDVFKLLCGCKLKSSASGIVVKVKLRPAIPPTNEDRYYGR